MFHRHCFALAILLVVSSPAFAADIDSFTVRGRPIDLLIINPPTGPDQVYVTVRVTPSPFVSPEPFPAGELLVTCEGSARADCEAFVSPSVPTILEDCGEIDHATSSNGGTTIDYYVCSTGNGQCRQFDDGFARVNGEDEIELVANSTTERNENNCTPEAMRNQGP